MAADGGLALANDNRAAVLVDGLNPDDPGMTLLAGAVASEPSREILLVCCGDVPGVGPEATRLVLDVRERAGSIAHPVSLLEPPPNASFGHAIVWPRPHLGKDFTQWCLARAALSVRPDGIVWCAARKAKGAEGITRVLGELTGEVDVVGRSHGYRLLRARPTRVDHPRAQALLDAAYTIEDDALPGLSLRSAPGVFSRQRLDAGTRRLIEHALAHAHASPTSPRAVLDLGCGVGPLALWAARRFPAARVLAVDTNLRAVELARDNARRHDLADRVTVMASDGLPSAPDLDAQPGAPARGTLELALVNPPTHADPATLARLAEDLRDGLAPGAPALLVVSRSGRMIEVLSGAGARVSEHRYERYTVLDARWGPA